MALSPPDARDQAGLEQADASLPTRLHQPVILVRGFGGLGVEDEKRLAYQGFNDGTVYPGKRGENYIYEGLILRFMKSQWQYQDATNIVGYYGETVKSPPPAIPSELADLGPGFFDGGKVIVDPGMALSLLKGSHHPHNTLWVFRYYDLNDRAFDAYGAALVRLIGFIRELVKKKEGVATKVNIIAHSMGGLIVRHAIQCTMPEQGLQPAASINKIVTLGTPHQGISFQILKNWIPIAAEKELEAFNPGSQSDAGNPSGFKNFAKHFPVERLLTVVGTNYRSYGVTGSSAINRLFSVSGEFGLNYNRSDGLVKQSNAQVPGAPRTFVHKCHGGMDSLVTSREAFEIASRFFFGDVRVRLNLMEAEITRGFDLIGKSEMFFGVSVKPRGVDFDLFHQSAEAENCYGPFATKDLSDPDPAFDWAGEDRLIWEGWLDTSSRFLGGARGDEAGKDIVMRLDIYVGERDLFGIGFSDNVIFRKQYYVRSVLRNKQLQLWLYTGEEFRAGVDGKRMAEGDRGWTFDVLGTGFKAKMCVSFDVVPEVGMPMPWSQPAN